MSTQGWALSPRTGTAALAASPPASPRSPQQTLSKAQNAEADASSGSVVVVIPMATSVAGSPSGDHGLEGSSVFSPRPAIAPEAFYFPNDDGPAHTLSVENDDGFQKGGSPDLVVEEEKAKMAQLLDEMTASVSHVAQRDLFHTLQRRFIKMKKNNFRKKNLRKFF